MSVTYEWVISSLEVEKEVDGHENVVKTVHWRCVATDAEGVSADTYGSLSLDLDKDVDFVPYDTLTKDEVVSWIKGPLDVGAIKTSLAEQIDAKVDPVVVTLTPPWDSIDEPADELVLDQPENDAKP